MQKPIIFLSLLFSAGCEQEKPKKAEPESDCTLSLNDLSDLIWVMLDVEKGEEPNPRQRVKFYKDGEKLKVLYPKTNDYAGILEYECELDEAGTALNCETEPKIEEACMALIAGDKKCVLKPMQAFHPDFTNEQIKQANEDAKLKVSQWKRNGTWKARKKMYNNLGKHLKDVLSIRVDKNACNLSVTDNYQTIFNGEVSENANPVGTSNFAKWDKGKLMWESCKDSWLMSSESETYPTEANTQREYPKDSTIHYWYWAAPQNQPWSSPTEGCNYKYDLYEDQQLVKEGLVPETITIEKPKKDEPKSRLVYHTSKTYSKLSNKSYPYVVAMDITKTCGDKTERKVTCSATHIVKPPPPPAADGDKTKVDAIYFKKKSPEAKQLRGFCIQGCTLPFRCRFFT